jgi:hypothetical protein
MSKRQIINNLTELEIVNLMKEHNSMQSLLKFAFNDNTKKIDGHYTTIFRSHCRNLNLDIENWVSLSALKNKNHNHMPITKIENEEIFKENSEFHSRSSIKKRLLNDYNIPNECAICKLSTLWMDKPLTLQLDHINGISNDHSLENLRLLCPNCHSQTSTYARTKTRSSKKINKCADCGIVISIAAKRCKNCGLHYTAQQRIGTKHNKTPMLISEKEFIVLFDKIGCAALGRQLNISKSTISYKYRRYKTKN